MTIRVACETNPTSLDFSVAIIAKRAPKQVAINEAINGLIAEKFIPGARSALSRGVWQTDIPRIEVRDHTTEAFRQKMGVYIDDPVTQKIFSDIAQEQVALKDSLTVAKGLPKDLSQAVTLKVLARLIGLDLISQVDAQFAVQQQFGVGAHASVLAVSKALQSEQQAGLSAA
jgi:hypothetical protein